MTDTTVETNPLRGHVVSFPKAIPSRTWMADRMLWADHLGAVWPASYPFARSTEDELALKHLAVYHEAGFFTERRLRLDDSTQLEHDLEQALMATDHDSWLRMGRTASFDRIIPPRGQSSTEQPFYPDKFPENIKQMLLRTGVASQSRPHGMLRVRSPEKVQVLLNALANYAKPWGQVDLPLTLEAEDDLALAHAAAPASDGASWPAVSVEIPVIEGAWGEITPEQLIGFRENQANERARQDYLCEVANRVAEITRLAQDDPAAVANQIISDDLKLATRSLAERAGALSLTGLAISAVGTFAPVSPESASEWVSLGATVAGLGLAAYTTLRPTPAHGYIRRVRKADLRRRR